MLWQPFLFLGADAPQKTFTCFSLDYVGRLFFISQHGCTQNTSESDLVSIHPDGSGDLITAKWPVLFNSCHHVNKVVTQIELVQINEWLETNFALSGCVSHITQDNKDAQGFLRRFRNMLLKWHDNGTNGTSTSSMMWFFHGALLFCLLFVMVARWCYRVIVVLPFHPKRREVQAQLKVQ